MTFSNLKNVKIVNNDLEQKLFHRFFIDIVTVEH